MTRSTKDEGLRQGPLARLLERARHRARPARFSTVLRLIGESAGERVSLAALVDVFGDRVFGALMFIFAVPNVLPLPPGTSSVLSAPLILIAAQLAVGRRTLWLPRSVADRSISREDFQRISGAVLPMLRRVERVLAPRLDFLFGRIGDRLIGIVCLILAVVLFLPIPLGNMLPGLAVALFSLALIQRDGLAAIAGWLATAASVTVLGLISGALWIGVKAFFHALMG